MQAGQINCISVQCRSASVVAPNRFSVSYGLANAVDPDHCSAPYRSVNVVLKSFLHAIQVGQCSWPKSLLRAILVGWIRYLSMPYRSANAVGPNHFSVSYGLAGYDLIHVIQVGQCTWTKSFPRAIQVGLIQSYPRHTGRAMQFGQSIDP